MLGRRPEAELEDEEAEDRDRTVAVRGVLQGTNARNGLSTSLARGSREERKTDAGELEAKGGTEDDAEEGGPAHGEADHVRELEEGRLDAGNPDSLDGACHDRVGDEPERDDPCAREVRKALSDRARRAQKNCTHRRKNHAQNVCTIL